MRRTRNPLAHRDVGHLPSHTAPTLANVEKMMEDADEVTRTASQWLARWHNYGQSHWLGGDLKHGKSWSPPARVKAAFKKMNEAMHAAQSASHELGMLYIEIGTQGVAKPNPKRGAKTPLKRKTAKRPTKRK